MNATSGLNRLTPNDNPSQPSFITWLAYPPFIVKGMSLMGALTMLFNIVGTVELFINNMMSYTECIKSIQYQADCNRQEAIGILLWVADVACE